MNLQNKKIWIIKFDAKLLNSNVYGGICCSAFNKNEFKMNNI